IRRPVVDARAGSAGRLCGGYAKARDGNRAAEAVQGRRSRRGSRESVRAVSVILRDVREGPRLQPEGCRGLHPPLRARDQDRGGARGRAPARDWGGRGLMAPPPPSPPSPPPPPPPLNQPTESAPHHMWGGRFALGPSEALDALNRSLPVDHRLWPQDVAASKAWVHALGRVGVLTPTEESHLLDGLDRVAERLADG